MTPPEPIKLKSAAGTYYECPLCKYYTYSRATVTKHISKCILKIPRKRSSDTDDLEQPKEKIPRTESDSQKYQKVHEEFRCKYCQLMFSTKKQRNTHERTVHPSGEVVKTRDEIQSSTSTALALVDDVKTSDVALINDEDDIHVPFETSPDSWPVRFETSPTLRFLTFLRSRSNPEVSSDWIPVP